MSVSIQKPGKRDTKKVLGFAEAGKSKSGLLPEGDRRLTANIRADLHTRLKIESAKQGVTMGELIEQLIETHIPEG